MAPLNIEAYREGSWSSVGICEPGGYGKLTDIRPEGGHNDYLFWCLGDNSVVDCFEGGRYVIVGHGNIIAVKDRMSSHEIRKNDAPYEITIRSRENPAGRPVRFTHV